MAMHNNRQRATRVEEQPAEKLKLKFRMGCTAILPTFEFYSGTVLRA